MDDEILTLSQVLEFLPIGDDKLRRMAKAQEIPCRKVGGRYLFIKSDVIAWIREGYQQEAKPSHVEERPRLVGAALSREYDRLLGLTAKKKRAR